MRIRRLMLGISVFAFCGGLMAGGGDPSASSHQSTVENAYVTGFQHGHALGSKAGVAYAAKSNLDDLKKLSTPAGTESLQKSGRKFGKQALGAIKKAASVMAQGAHRVKDKAQEVASKAGHEAHKIQDKASGTWHKFYGKAKETAHDFADEIKDAYHDLKEHL
jgi:ElaB/YqjD/DUF883 family membrane-anchored ribosome-binding protein